MSKVLVTGGLGFIGKHLVYLLRKRGHDVWTIDLYHHHDSKHIRCNVASAVQLQKIFEQHSFDYVYHLAAEFGRWNGEEYYDTLWYSNVIGTKNILRWQERKKFRLIFASSSEVYGDYDGLMVEEVMDKYEIRQLNDYALTKWVGENQIMNSEKMFGTESVRVRFFNTYGPGEYYSPYRSANCAFIYHALHSLPYTVYLNHHRTSSYITDTVETLSNIINNFIPGRCYNIAGIEDHTIKAFSDIVLKVIGIDDKLVEYKETEPFTTKSKYPDISKATRELNHNPKISLTDGIEKTVKWMKEIYLNKTDVANHFTF